jgi:outer membrane receptor for ferrienterochelin and colicins
MRAEIPSSERGVDMRVKALVFLSIATQALPVLSQEPKVHIVGTQTDTEARRDFVAGTIIISRKRIEESGVRSVEELLKREPAVTVRDGRISLLNLPGYTQILLDGQAAPAGRSPTDLDVIHVEQIEIIKSSAAQYGPFGIAGTINIVTRKTVRKTSTALNAGAQAGDRGAANLAVSHDQSTAGSRLKYSLRLSAMRNNVRRKSRMRQTLSQDGAGELEQWLAVVSEDSHMPIVAVSGNVTWQSVKAGTVTLSPEIYKMGGGGVQTEFREWESGSTLNVKDRDDVTSESFSLPLKWTIKPTGKSYLELIARAYVSRFDTKGTRIDTVSGTDSDIRTRVERHKANTNKLDLDYRVSLDGGHAIRAGVSLLRAKTDGGHDHRINGSQDAALNALGIYRLLRSEQQRLYLQDEWRISESLAGKIGVSGAQNSIDAREGARLAGARFRMWSPSLHLSEKLGGDDKQQLRISLARSFKAPSDQELTQRPEINPLAPCLGSGVCPANTIDTADTSGNLQLRPERGLGLNLSYEHGIGDDSQFTIEVFTRQIEGKLGKQILLENVPWAAVQRYVSRPTNLGNARSTGINFEMELALRDLAKAAPKATVRGSVGLARSRISNLPGPDNYLDKQTPWTAKLGGSYGMKTAPIKFDMDANWGPGQWTRTSLSERAYEPRILELDASMSWSINKDSRLVVGLGAKYPSIHQPISEYSENDQLVRLYTSEKRSARLKLQFDTKL